MQITEMHLLVERGQRMRDGETNVRKHDFDEKTFLPAFSVLFLRICNHLKITKKLHLTLRAKRGMFTLLVDKSSLKMPKIVNLASN